VHLTPSETEKLLLAVAGMVARDRRERGVRLNYPETVALLSTWVVEEARAGASVSDLMERGREVLEVALSDAGLPAGLAAAYDDASWDATIQADTDEALSLTGKDVGTPILHVAPPQGAAFFGPVISRVPSDEDALRLWDHVVGLATFPGFAEMKRSLRELPQLRALGVAEDEVGRTEDWHGGSRRLKK
jgi:urease gamma subunit